MRPGEADGPAAVVAVVGPGWSAAADREGHRLLDDESDSVRRTIEDALAAGLPVVPVVLEGAEIPGGDELPPSLVAFAAARPVRAVDEYWDETVERVVARLEPRTGRGTGLAAALRRRPRLTIGGTVGIVAAVVGILGTLGFFRHSDAQAGTLAVGPRSTVDVRFADYLRQLGPEQAKPDYPMVHPDDHGFVYDIQLGLERAEHGRYSIRWTMRDVTDGKAIEPFEDLVGASFGPRDGPGLHEVWIPCPRQEARRYIVQFMLVDEARPDTPLQSDESPEGECRLVER